MDNSGRYDKILLLIKMFNNRPHLLTRYLLENSAFDDKFIEKVLQNKKIDEVFESQEKVEDIKFGTISEIQDYYNSLIETSGKSKSQLSNELNNKLNIAILNEKYEEAAKIRDYMKNNNIKKFDIF
jgi:Mg/Co/Ni transporter MgtE